VERSGADPAQFETVVPADGQLVIGITSLGDFGFTGAGFFTGTYSVKVDNFLPAGSISGRVVDAATQLPLAGVFVNLTHCTDATCVSASNVYSVYTDPLGQFTIAQGFTGAPLDPGWYTVSANPFFQRYLSAALPPFTVGSGENKVLPNLQLPPAPVIGSISGRIVDSVTHAPLSGLADPHAHVSLFGCASYGCVSLDGFADGTGRFRFDHDSSGLPILAVSGLSMMVVGDQYQQIMQQIPALTPGENLDLGDIPLISNPVRFTLLQGCTSVPASGGTCQYSIQVTNGSASSVEGTLWGTVNTFGLGSFVNQSTFEIGDQELSLAAATRTTRSSKSATFRLTIPPSVPPGAFICPTFWFGVDPVNPKLHTQGMMAFAGCVQKLTTGLVPATAAQTDALRKALREHEAKENAAAQAK